MSEPIIPEIVTAEAHEALALTLLPAIAETARNATATIRAARAWYDENGISVGNASEAKAVRASVNKRLNEASDLRKAIQRKVAEAMSPIIAPVVDAEKAAKALADVFKSDLDALDAKPRMVAPHYVEVVCDQYQWTKITEAIGKALASGGSLQELDPACVSVPAELRGGNVPV